MTAAYTLVPSPRIAELLDRALVGIAADIGALKLPGLRAVVLGGGYGRGEGGVLHTASGDALYNDLDFFVFSSGAGRALRDRIDRALRELAGPWTEKLGVAVDFGPVKNCGTLKKVASTLMFQELLRGWKPVWGTPELADWIPALDPRELPFSEIAACAEGFGHIGEEIQVDVDAFIGGTIERTGVIIGMSAAGIHRIRKQRERWIVVLQIVGFKDLMPDIFGACEDDGDEFFEFAFVFEFAGLIGIAFGIAIGGLCIELAFGTGALLGLSLLLSQLRRNILSGEQIDEQRDDSHPAAASCCGFPGYAAAIVLDI